MGVSYAYLLYNILKGFKILDGCTVKSMRAKIAFPK